MKVITGIPCITLKDWIYQLSCWLSLGNQTSCLIYLQASIDQPLLRYYCAHGLVLSPCLKPILQNIASFPGLPTVQFFWLLAVCKHGGGRPGSILPHEWRQCRQREVGVPNWKNAFHTHVLRFEPGVVLFSLYKCLKHQCLERTTR